MPLLLVASHRSSSVNHQALHVNDDINRHAGDGGTDSGGGDGNGGWRRYVLKFYVTLDTPILVVAGWILCQFQLVVCFMCVFYSVYWSSVTSRCSFYVVFCCFLVPRSSLYALFWSVVTRCSSFHDVFCCLVARCSPVDCDF